MKVFYVASEANPYAASGGLGDVMGALPAAVKRLAGKGSEVSVILPLYRTVKPEYREKMKKVMDFHFFLGWRNAYCGVFELKQGGVRYLFLDNEYYFYRDQLYGDFDDGERFAYFSRAVVEYMCAAEDYPDVLHVNDWQSAMSVVYLREKHKENQHLARIRTVLTIHNIEYQGKYDLRILGDVFDLDSSCIPTVEYGGAINLLKAGMMRADAVTTVSPTYAQELKEDFFAFGLQHVVRMCEGKMCGIINGLDTAYFDPSNEKDGIIPYTVRNVKEGKAANKAALQKALSLPERADVPLIVMITRLTAGKGVDLVLHIFEELMEQDVQFVLLGTGDENYERIFSTLCARHGDRARAEIRFDRTLSKQMYAAADLFLMPSKSEPCGLAQMTSCRYGTLPVVRCVGGLADSITPYGCEGANGFVFRNFNAHELLFKVKEALNLYRDEPETWDNLVRTAMDTNFTWGESAKKYLALYENLIGEK